MPSEDALILHLQLAKGQEKLVEALRAQQVVLRDLQQQLVEQQEALLAQQSAILERQRLVHEHVDTVKAQYGLLADAFRQAASQGLQGALRSYFQSHQNQAGGHLGRPYTPDRAGAAPKAVDFPQPLRGCAAPCGQEEYCNAQRAPPRCDRCTTCPPGFFLTSPCSATADRMCQVPLG